jgi:putative membrane protein
MMWGPFGMMLGPLFMILIVAAVILLIRWLVPGAGHMGHMGSHSGSQTHTALNILKERFARGEIDKAEFEERRRVLGE